MPHANRSSLPGLIQPAPKYLTVTLSASGDVVAAVTSKKIRVLSYSIQTDAALTVSLTSGASPTVLGTQNLSAKQQIAESCAAGLMETASGAALKAVQTGAGNVTYRLTYQEV